MEKKEFKLEDLDVWKKGRALRKEISKLAKEFPEHEKFKLIDQMLRASRSITANLAEGYGRFHYQENIQFCRQARGSLFELLDHITVAFDENYINENELETYKNSINEVIRLVNGFIKYLKSQKNSQNK